MTVIGILARYDKLEVRGTGKHVFSCNGSLKWLAVPTALVQMFSCQLMYCQLLLLV